MGISTEAGYVPCGEEGVYESTAGDSVFVYGDVSGEVLAEGPSGGRGGLPLRGRPFWLGRSLCPSADSRPRGVSLAVFVLARQDSAALAPA